MRPSNNERNIFTDGSSKKNTFFLSPWIYWPQHWIKIFIRTWLYAIWQQVEPSLTVFGKVCLIVKFQCCCSRLTFDSGYLRFAFGCECLTSAKFWLKCFLFDFECFCLSLSEFIATSSHFNSVSNQLKTTLSQLRSISNYLSYFQAKNWLIVLQLSTISNQLISM